MAESSVAIPIPAEDLVRTGPIQDNAYAVLGNGTVERRHPEHVADEGEGLGLTAADGEEVGDARGAVIEGDLDGACPRRCMQARA
jgi:hypothetical protein